MDVSLKTSLHRVKTIALSSALIALLNAAKDTPVLPCSAAPAAFDDIVERQAVMNSDSQVVLDNLRLPNQKVQFSNSGHEDLTDEQSSPQHLVPCRVVYADASLWRNY